MTDNLAERLEAWGDHIDVTIGEWIVGSGVPPKAPEPLQPLLREAAERIRQGEKVITDLLTEADEIQGAFTRLKREYEPPYIIYIPWARPAALDWLDTSRLASRDGWCPNGPDPETGEWPCDPLNHGDGTATCQACGFLGAYPGERWVLSS